MFEEIDFNLIFNIICIALILFIIFRLLFRKRKNQINQRKDWRRDWHVTGAPSNIRKALQSKPGSMKRRDSYVYQKSGGRILRARV